MKTHSWIFLSLLFLGFQGAAGAVAQKPVAIFQEANAAYRGGDYSKATSLYESLIDMNWKKANVFYNLGNAYFREKRLGLAILNYERAKRMTPRDRDISANLAYVRGLLEYRIEDKRNWYSKMGETIPSAFTMEQTGIVTLTISLLFWIGLIVSLYTEVTTSWGWGKKSLLVLTLVSLSIWSLKGLHNATVHEAIVIKEQASVRYGPSYKDQAAFKLGEGIKVRVKKTEGEWSQVVLSNGETGWVAEEEIGVI